MNATEKKIYNYLKKNPAASAFKIAESTGLVMKTVSNSANKMVKELLLVKSKEGNSVIFGLYEDTYAAKKGSFKIIDDSDNDQGSSESLKSENDDQPVKEKKSSQKSKEAADKVKKAPAVYPYNIRNLEYIKKVMKTVKVGDTLKFKPTKYSAATTGALLKKTTFGDGYPALLVQDGDVKKLRSPNLVIL